MGLLTDWRTRRKGRRQVGLGMGPFGRRALEGLAGSYCSRCGRPISESTLFGNAITIGGGGVHCLCSSCRTGVQYKLYPEHPFNACSRTDAANQSVDRILMIGEMADLIASGHLGLTWFDIVVCLRLGVGGLQRHHRRRFSGFDRDRVRRGREQFGRLLPGSCGECGALWANEWEYARGVHLQSGARSHRWSDTECWACGFPHELQWFMRCTIEDELAELSHAHG